VAKILGIIQARMSSTRLPAKVMLPILNQPILWHINHRLKQSHVDDICIATSTNPNDDEIVQFAVKENIQYFRGSETLVLDRLIGAAEKFNADAIVRVTADCPLFDPNIINDMIKIYKEQKEFDFVSNTVERTFPDGLDIELMSKDFLYKLSNSLQDPFLREWFPMYIVENYKQFRFLSYTNKDNLSHLRWTIDFAEDYEFVKKIYEDLYPKFDVFNMQNILDLLENKPELTKINQKYSADTSSTIYHNLKNNST